VQKLFPLITKLIELRRNQKLSRSAFEARQLNKFRKLVRYVNQHSPYYQNLIRQRQIPLGSCKPEDFPVLTKRDVMEHFDQMVTDPRLRKADVIRFLDASKDCGELFLNEYYVISTSGSSGELGYFVYSQSDWARGFARVMQVHKVSLHKIKQAFVGATTGHYAGVSMISNGQYFKGRKNYELRVLNINQPLSDLIGQLNEFQPDTLVGYAEALRFLAEQQLAGRLAIHPSWIDSSGEVLNDDVREYIETAFKIPVQNLYASSEFLLMGYGRQELGGMVLLEDDLIFEIEDTATVVTSLFNYTLPLIRYRMNDVLQPKTQQFHGPRRLVSQVVGRMEQAPFFVNEQGEKDYLNPHVIDYFFVKNLHRFQIHVKNESSLELRVVFEAGISSTTRTQAMKDLSHRLDAILKEKKMTNVSYEIREVDQLHVDARTGKFRFIVNDMNFN